MAEAKGAQIYGLIGKAMAKVGAIGKDAVATNYQGKQMYKFRGIDAVYNALNPVMSELGLFIVPEILEQKREERKSTSGGTLIYSILTVRFTMFAPDGSFIQGTVIGEGMDSGDKATNKAMSIAMKYFCFQTFLIPTEDMKDPDAEVHDVAPREQKNDNPPAVQDAPANVTTSAKLPEEKPVNPVFAYIENEKAFMAQRLEITDPKIMKAKFAAMRKTLIDGKVVDDVPPAKLTMEQAKVLVSAIYANFFTDKGEGK